MKVYKLEKCRYFKNYKGKRQPTCGCRSCNEKYEKLNKKD